MTGFTGAGLVSHVVRRGLEQLPANTQFDGSDVVAFKNKPDGKMPIPMSAFISAGIIMAISLIICASIDYTIGSLMASLAMIESPTTTTILDPNPAPPAYTDEPDAPLNKNQNQTGLEGVPVMTLQSIPITGQATYKFLAHLRSVGGFFARWRGFGQYIVYHVALNFLGHGLGNLFSKLIGPFGQFLGMTIATILTVRLHMLWTHAMIGTQSSVAWYRRIVPRKQCKVLLLPVVTYALALQLVFFVPLLVAHLVGTQMIDRFEDFQGDDAVAIRAMDIFTAILRILTIPASAVLIALTVLLPAAATLVRVEACLLPEEQETIVSFDKETIMGDVDINERGSSKKIFSAAWRSFSRAARWRVVKVLLKSFIYQFVVGGLGFSIALAVFWMIGGDAIKDMAKQVSSSMQM